MQHEPVGKAGHAGLQGEEGTVNQDGEQRITRATRQKQLLLMALEASTSLSVSCTENFLAFAT